MYAIPARTALHVVGPGADQEGCLSDTRVASIRGVVTQYVKQLSDSIAEETNNEA